MNTGRRWFIAGVASFLAAPAIIRTPGLLMNINPIKIESGLILPNQILSELFRISIQVSARRLLADVTSPIPFWVQHTS